MIHVCVFFYIFSITSLWQNSKDSKKKRKELIKIVVEKNNKSGNLHY